MDRGVSIKAEVEQSISLAMAQSAAIVYGQILTDEEISNLLTQLFSLPSPMRTPDGKLVFSIIEHSYIEKLF
jgi:DNA mismatch repair protein MutL